MEVLATPVTQWSKYQTDIFDFTRHGQGNAIVNAVAGSGKSTTVEGAVKCTAGTHVVLAFNKAIADAMKQRGINGRTFHSLTFSPVMRAKGQSNPTTSKLRDLIEENLTGNDIRTYGSFIARLVGLGRNAGIGCLEMDTPEAWYSLIDHHDLELDSDYAKIERAVELASNLLTWCYESPLVDFDDMLYLAVRDGISLSKFDWVFVDEAQDTNVIQRAILRKIMKPASRLIAVGDRAQAIYGFRGADSNSLQLIADEFNCIELPLTVSYRCPTTVVRYAHKWVSHIEAAPGAPAGEVKDLGRLWVAKDFAAQDLIVCRTTKPLISLAYQLIKMRVPAHIMGRDIGKNLASLINKLNAKGVDELNEKLFKWSTREHERAIAKKQEAKAETIIDKRDAILVLIEALSETDRTVSALLRLIDDMFTDVKRGVTLATIHKSKGLQAERVFWLNASQCPAPWATQEWQKQQERNLCYVATTRAMSKLFLIDEKLL